MDVAAGASEAMRYGAGRVTMGADKPAPGLCGAQSPRGRELDQEVRMARRPRTVLVTGCSSGIGAALANAFHDAGYTVYATARREDTLAPLRSRGIATMTLDVNDQMSIDVAVTRIEEEHENVDVLINNAGFGAMGPLAEMPLSRLRRQFETNVIGPVALTQAVVPGMVRRRRGCIVNIGSVSGVLTTPFAGAYCASKAALHSLSDALRMELSPFGIAVVTVQPGAIRSRFGDTAVAGVTPPKRGESLYEPVEDGIQARAGASQVDATSPETVAAAVLRAVSRRRPPHTVRTGNGSLKLALLRWLLPTRLLDRSLARRFGLDRLGRE